MKKDRYILKEAPISSEPLIHDTKTGKLYDCRTILQLILKKIERMEKELGDVEQGK